MNRFTELVGSRLPLQQAGMSGTATSTLAAAVSNAGALGMIGVGRQQISVVGPVPRRGRHAHHRAGRLHVHRPFRAARRRRTVGIASADRRVLLRMAGPEPRPGERDLRLAGRIRRRSQGGRRRRLPLRDRPRYGGRRSRARAHPAGRVAAGSASRRSTCRWSPPGGSATPRPFVPRCGSVPTRCASAHDSWQPASRTRIRRTSTRWSPPMPTTPC